MLAGVQLKPGVYLAPKTRLEDVSTSAAAAGPAANSAAAAAHDGSRPSDQAGAFITTSNISKDTGIGPADQLLVSMRGPRRAGSPLRHSYSPNAASRDAAGFSRASQIPTSSQVLNQPLEVPAGGAALGRTMGRATERLRGSGTLGAGLGAGMTSSSSSSSQPSGLQSTAAMVAAAAADYSYPNMGYSQMVQSPQSFQAQLRGHELDVYGNPRVASPPLPNSHLRVSKHLRIFHR